MREKVTELFQPDTSVNAVCLTTNGFVKEDNDMMRRVLVCGSRDFYDAKMIHNVLSRLPEHSTIIEGEARGADTHARIEGQCLGFTIERYPADWNEYGKAAGFIRNEEMINSGVDEVIAFCSKQKLEDSRGTADTVRRARSKRIPVRVYYLNGKVESF